MADSVLVALSPEGADNTGSAIREFDYAVRLDWPVFVFAAGVMIFVGIGVGLFPAWRAARADLRGGLSNIGRGATLDLATRRWLSGLIMQNLPSPQSCSSEAFRSPNIFGKSRGSPGASQPIIAFSSTRCLPSGSSLLTKAGCARSIARWMNCGRCQVSARPRSRPRRR